VPCDLEETELYNLETPAGAERLPVWSRSRRSILTCSILDLKLGEGASMDLETCRPSVDPTSRGVRAPHQRLSAPSQPPPDPFFLTPIYEASP